MANPVITINDFSPGLMTDADPRSLPPGAAQAAQNVTIDQGNLRVREGRTIAIAGPAHLSTNIRVIGEIHVADHSPAHRFVAINATKIYWQVTQATATARANGTAYSQGKMLRPATANGYLYEVTTAGTTGGSPPTYPTTAGGTVSDGTAVLTCRATDMWDEIDSTQSVHATNDVTLTQYDNKLYIVDGSAYCKTLDADGNFTTLTEFYGPTTAPLLSDESKDYVIDMCNQRTATTAKQPPASSCAGQGMYWDGFWYVGNPNISFWYVKKQADTPDTSDVDEVKATLNSTHPFTGTNNGLFGAHTYSMSLRIDCDASYTDTLDVGDIYLIRQLSAPVDITAATAATFSMYFDTGAATQLPASVEIGFGETLDETAWVWNSVDVSGAARNVWTEATNRFTAAITTTGLNAVRYIGIRFLDLVISPNATPAGTDNDYAEFIFSPILLNISKAQFVPGTYEFTYTLWDGTQESSEYISTADLEHPYPQLTLSADIPQSITATCTRPIGSTATTAYLYVQGGASAEFRRVGEGAFTGDATAERTVDIVWYGEYEANDEWLTPYIGKPPVGAIDVIIYRNRAWYLAPIMQAAWQYSTVYAAGDDMRPTTPNGYSYICTVAGTSAATEPTWGTQVGATTADGTVTWRCQRRPPADVLYGSNYGDPAHCPQAPTALLQTPVTYGGWVDTEKRGDDGVGLGTDGLCLYVLKKQAVFRLQGDPGLASDHPDTFRQARLNTTEGCVSKRSICHVGNRLVWHGKDKLLSIGPDEIAPVEITKDIRPTVKGYSSTLQELSWCVYDPAMQRLYVAYPSGSYGTSPNSEWLVLSLTKGSWLPWGAMPGVCGIYSAHSATSGLYIADGYGTSGRGKTFILSSSAVTDAINYGSAAAISWYWISGDIQPLPGGYIRPVYFRGRLLLADATSAYTLAATLWLNNSDDRTATRNITITRNTTTGSATTGNGIASWTLANYGEVESFAVKLARNDSNIIAIRDIAVEVSPAGPVKGRTIAR